MGVSLTETPLDRDPLDRDPTWTETHWTETTTGQRTPGQKQPLEGTCYQATRLDSDIIPTHRRNMTDTCENITSDGST